MIRKVAFTMYPVKDMKRARNFYENELGMKPTANYREEWIEYDLPQGGCFAITTMVPIEPSASSGGSIAFEVTDVDGMTATLKDKGYTVKVPPMSSPVCRMSVILDTEGNALTLHKVNRDA